MGGLEAARLFSALQMILISLDAMVAPEVQDKMDTYRIAVSVSEETSGFT